MHWNGYNQANFEHVEFCSNLDFLNKKCTFFNFIKKGNLNNKREDELNLIDCLKWDYQFETSLLEKKVIDALVKFEKLIREIQVSVTFSEIINLHFLVYQKLLIYI